MTATSWAIPDASSTAHSGPNALMDLSVVLGSYSGSLLEDRLALQWWLLQPESGTNKSWHYRFEQALDRFKGLQSGWAHSASIPPSTTALHLARQLLQLFWGRGLRPARLAPTSDGGIAIYFLTRYGLASVEATEEGEAVFSPPFGYGEPDVIDLQDCTASEEVLKVLGRTPEAGSPLENVFATSGS